MALSQAASFDVDFSALRDSILDLQRASAKLDVEKSEAEGDLRKILKHLKKCHKQRRKVLRKIRKIICKLKKLFGKECRSGDIETATTAEFGLAFPLVRIAILFDAFPSLSKKKLVKAIERVQVVNKKLIKFERGFISKDGIKDREWYKHLGVAPGKWLGKSQENKGVTATYFSIRIWRYDVPRTY